MQFSRHGEYISVARITGAADNLLQVRISVVEPESIGVEVFPSIGVGTKLLDKDKVLAAVVDGLRQVNEELGKSYWISHIRFVANDSKPEAVYSFLTQTLLRHLDAGNPFVGA